MITRQQIGLRGALTLMLSMLVTVVFIRSSSHAQTYHGLPDTEKILEMKFPLRLQTRVTRTSLQYMDDYQDLGIQTKGLPSLNRTTTNTSCDPNSAGNLRENDFCFANNLAQTVYHEGTDDQYKNDTVHATRARGAIDIAAYDGTPVYAGVTGTVTQLPICASGGLLTIRLDDDRGYLGFLHLNRAAEGIGVGTDVFPDTLIAYSGTCGGVEPHLHIYAWNANNTQDVEIRFTDRYVQYVSDGLPTPEWMSITGRDERNPDVYPDSVTLPGIWPPASIDSGERPLPPVIEPDDLRFGMRVRVRQGAPMYRHYEYDGANRLLPTVTDFDRSQAPTLSSGHIVKIHRGPSICKFGISYPHVNAADYWWETTTGSRNDQSAPIYWVRETDLTTCLSDEWCDVEQTASLYPFAREAKRRSETDVGGFTGCYSTSGYSWLCADADLKRDQAAKVVWEIALGRSQPPACTTNLFPDVAADSRLCPYIQGLKENEIVRGKSDGYFYPAASVSKGELASMIANALQKAGVTCSSANSTDFAREITDVPSSNKHYSSVLCLWNALREYKSALHAEFGTSVNLGSQDKFNPDANISRLQATKLVAVATVILANKESEPEEGQGNNLRGSGKCYQSQSGELFGCDGVSLASTDTNAVTTQLVTPWGDEDWMTLQIEDTAADFTMFSSSAGLNAWIEATLFDADGVTVASAISGELAPHFQLKADLEQGVYYIRLRNVLPYARWGTDYKITLVVRPGELQNVALGKSATASAEGDTANRVNDGDQGTYWSAKGFAPQWIQIDFGGEIGLEKMRMLIDQTPSGNTTHDLYIFRDARCETPLFLHRFEGYTQHHDWLEYSSPTTPILTRCVRVQTVASPSWISWYETEVYERQEQSPISDPDPDPTPPPIETSSYADIFDAASIEDVAVRYDANGDLNASFRIYNRGGHGLKLPLINDMCQVGFWQTNLSGDSVGWLAHDSDRWDGPECYWPSGEYVEYKASKEIALAPGAYHLEVSIYHLNFPSDKAKKIASIPFLVSFGSGNSVPTKTQIHLPWIGVR